MARCFPVVLVALDGVLAPELAGKPASSNLFALGLLEDLRRRHRAKHLGLIIDSGAVPDTLTAGLEGFDSVLVSAAGDSAALSAWLEQNGLRTDEALLIDRDRRRCEHFRDNGGKAIELSTLVDLEWQSRRLAERADAGLVEELTGSPATISRPRPVPIAE